MSDRRDAGEEGSSTVVPDTENPPHPEEPFLQVEDFNPGQQDISINLSEMTPEEMEWLCAELERPDCAVEVLRLAEFRLSDRCCSALSSALKANPSFLRVLHLTEVIISEDFQLKLLCDALGSRHCRIRTLRLVNCGLFTSSCVCLSDAIKRNPSHLQELDLSLNLLEDSGVEILCDGLMDESCIKRLNLTSCYVTGESCRHLNILLMSTCGSLQELNLSHNLLEDDGMEQLSVGLSSSKCKLTILRLAQCKVTDKGCAVLIEALERRSVPLDELDLEGNDFSYKGRAMLNQFMIDWGFKERLRMRLSREQAASPPFSEGGEQDPGDQTQDSQSGVTTVLLPDPTTAPGPHRKDGSLFVSQAKALWKSMNRGMFSGAAWKSRTRLQTAQSELSDSESSFPSSVEYAYLEYLEPESSRGNTEVEEPETNKAPSYFESEVFHEHGRISYRFRGLGPGVFLCKLTGLGFTMTRRGELFYNIVQWDEDLLQSAGKLPAGPLFEIDGSTSSVSQLHLLHCEQNPAALSHSLQAVHMSDEGLSILEPLELNDTTVVVDVSHFSGFGLVSVIDFFRGILNIPRLIRSKVLLFHRPTWTEDSQKVNVFLLPKNVPLEEVKSQQENAEYIEATSLCQLIVNHTYTLQCPESTLVQPKSSLFDLSFGKEHHPNFEIRLTRTTKDAAVVVREQDETTVWEYYMKLTASGATSASGSSSPLDQPPADQPTTTTVPAEGSEPRFGSVVPLWAAETCVSLGGRVEKRGAVRFTKFKCQTPAVSGSGSTNERLAARALHSLLSSYWFQTCGVRPSWGHCLPPCCFMARLLFLVSLLWGRNWNLEPNTVHSPDSGTQDLHAPLKARLSSMRNGFIARVSEGSLIMLMDELRQENVINELEYKHLKVMQPESKAATALIDMVKNKGEQASGIMIEAFSKIDSFLYADLNH